MTVITHALLPAVLSSAVLPKSSRREYFRAAGIVALSAIVPDIVDPHLSLAARYTSWSHTVFALGGFWALVLIATAIWPQRFPVRLALLAGFAYLSHLILDALSGGVPGLYPFSDEIFRVRLISRRLWYPSDLFFLLVGCLVFWWLPWMKWGRPRSKT